MTPAGCPSRRPRRPASSRTTPTSAPRSPAAAGGRWTRASAAWPSPATWPTSPTWTPAWAACWRRWPTCGYEEDTLVVLLSDHGELLGERGGAYTKYSLYDAALRVPLIVRWPGVSRPGLVSHAPVELVDLMPTWLAAAGLEAPPLLPGRSLRPLLEGQDPSGAPAGGAAAGWRTATLSEQYTSTGTPGAPRGQWALRERRYKLIERATGRSALYDLAEDPLEHHNRIDDPALADVRDRLRARLLRDVIARAEQFPARWEPAVAIAPPAPAP